MKNAIRMLADGVPLEDDVPAQEGSHRQQGLEHLTALLENLRFETNFLLLVNYVKKNTLFFHLAAAMLLPPYLHSLQDGFEMIAPE